MSFEIERFIELRPFLYHVTARANGPALADTMQLQSADILLRWAGLPELTRSRRERALAVQAGIHRIVLKDQAPLRARNVQLATQWCFEDFVEYLNQHVFFWPGDARGPVRQGGRLLDHYAASDPLVLRVSTRALFRSNIAGLPLFSAFNTGAPRMQGGNPVYRGPDLHQLASEFPRSPGQVAELAYRHSVSLPEETVFASGGGWSALRMLAA